MQMVMQEDQELDLAPLLVLGVSWGKLMRCLAHEEGGEVKGSATSRCDQ